MPRAASAVLIAAILTLLCACGDPPPPAGPPPGPVSWQPSVKSPKHLVLAAGVGTPPRRTVIIALDGTLRLRGIMGGSVMLMDAATGNQVGVVDALPDGTARLGQTILAADSMSILHLGGGQVGVEKVTESIDGKSDKELLFFLP